MQQLQGLPSIKKLIITVLRRLRRGAAGRSRLLANTSPVLTAPGLPWHSQTFGPEQDPWGGRAQPLAGAKSVLQSGQGAAELCAAAPAGTACTLRPGCCLQRPLDLPLKIKYKLLKINAAGDNP